MQNLESNKENKNPDHFLSNSFETTTTTTNPANRLSTSSSIDNNSELTNEVQNINLSTRGATRPTFSFASDYTPTPHHFSGLASSTSYNYAAYLPISTSSSFSVLNNDYNFSNTFANKPNAIVHPIRRSEQAALPKNHNNDQLRVTGYNPLLSVTYPQAGNANAHQFALELNRKLSHLSCSRDLKNSSQNGSNQEALNQRPLFITTVPRGIFLPPPKEIVLLSPSRKRQLYAYSSHPVVYNTGNSTLSTKYNNSTHQCYKNKVTTSEEADCNNRNAFTMAKDKYRLSSTTNASSHINGNNAATAAASDGSGGSNINTCDGVSTEVASKDKVIITTNNYSTTSKTSLLLNAVRGSYAPYPNVSSGCHRTKQPFHQQLVQNRSKRDIPPAEHYKNVMYERRVVRGSNFANNQLIGDYDPFDKAAELRRRQVLSKKKVNQRNQRNVLGTPPPVEGRRHEDVQTEKYLEELVVKPADVTVETQTDLFLEKPPTPPYIPAKIGIDVATEIAEGELFQFDAEAQPIIDVLVDNILELSAVEVAHEQEIAALRKKQQEYLAEREAELAELRRLEEEEIRIQAEKQRRLHQDAIAKTLDDEMQKGVTAAKLLQGHIASILPEILDNLEPDTDAAKKEKLMKTICPWLSAEVAEEVGHIVDSREILTVIIKEIIKQRAEIYGGYKQDMPIKLDHIDEEEHEMEEVCECEDEPHNPRCYN